MRIIRRPSPPDSHGERLCVAPPAREKRLVIDLTDLAHLHASVANRAGPLQGVSVAVERLAHDQASSDVTTAKVTQATTPNAVDITHERVRFATARQRHQAAFFRRVPLQGAKGPRVPKNRKKGTWEKRQYKQTNTKKKTNLRQSSLSFNSASVMLVPSLKRSIVCWPGRAVGSSAFQA